MIATIILIIDRIQLIDRGTPFLSKISGKVGFCCQKQELYFYRREKDSYLQQKLEFHFLERERETKVVTSIKLGSLKAQVCILKIILNSSNLIFKNL